MSDQQLLRCGRWTRLRARGCALPKVCCASMVVYKERYLIVFGGASDTALSNLSFVYDTVTNEWAELQTTGTELVRPRACHSAVIHDDRMIVYGGQDFVNPMMFDDVLELDLRTLQWSVVHAAPAEPCGPGARMYHTAHVFAGGMYVLLGRGSERSVAQTTWRLDLETYAWTRVQWTAGTDGCPANIPALLGHAAAAEGDRLYVFGGQTLSSDGVPGDFSNDLYELCFRTRTWRRLAAGARDLRHPRPAPRYACGMAVARGRVLIYGGDAITSAPTNYYGDCWEYEVPPAAGGAARDSSGGGWTPTHPPFSAEAPGARSGFAYASLRGALYVFGGEVYADGDLPTYSAELFRLALGGCLALSLAENVARWMDTATCRGQEEGRAQIIKAFDVSQHFRLSRALDWRQ